METHYIFHSFSLIPFLFYFILLLGVMHTFVMVVNRTDDGKASTALQKQHKMGKSFEKYLKIQAIEKLRQTRTHSIWTNKTIHLNLFFKFMFRIVLSLSLSLCLSMIAGNHYLFTFFSHCSGTIFYCPIFQMIFNCAQNCTRKWLAQSRQNTHTLKELNEEFLL